jgi:hypothetical protein
MSTVITNNVFSVDGRPLLFSSGSIVQCTVVRMDTRTGISCSNSGNGTEITGLRLFITPRSASNRIICKWMMNGEFSNENCVVTIFRNGGLITDGGAQGYNAQGGNTRWSGVSTSVYDQNNDSTGQNTIVTWSGIANTTSSLFFAPAVRSSNSGNYTFFINRTVASNGQNAYETPYSTGVCWEVAV